MTMGKEIRSRQMARDAQFKYLPDLDRYLLAGVESRYKFNIIGAGIMGQEHIRVTYLEGRAVVHGIYDPNPRSVETAQQTQHNFMPNHDLVVYDSLEAACNDPEVDGLIICTPNYTHLEVVKVAAQSGKHILLEKPISTTLHDALEITRIAENYGATFQLGLQYRYKSIYAEALYEALVRQSIGNIKMIGIQEHRIPFLDKVNQWNKFAKYSGNTLVEKCCHYFDLLNLFAGARPKTVYATGSMDVNFTQFEYKGEKSDILDNALVIVNYENGVRASFNLCMFAPMFYEEVFICGDEGRLKAWEKQDFMTNFELTTQLEISCGESKPSRHIEPGYPSWIENSGHNGATYYEHIHFIDNIDGRETSTATAQEGLWSVVVALAAQRSIEQGQVININDYLASEGVSL